MNEMLKVLPFWEKLTEEEKARVEITAYVRHFDEGEELYGPCADCLGMIHILRGKKKKKKKKKKKRKETLFHIDEGDNCVLSASCVMAHIHFESHIEAAKPSDVLIIPVKVFGELVEQNVYVRCYSYEVATRRFSAVVSVMEQKHFERMDKRVASYLLRLYRETGKTVIRITQEQLAQRINSVRETVSRTLNRFAGEGMIEIRRGSILLKDLQKLEQTAG